MPTYWKYASMFTFADWADDWTDDWTVRFEGIVDAWPSEVAMLMFVRQCWSSHADCSTFALVQSTAQGGDFTSFGSTGGIIGRGPLPAEQGSVQLGVSAQQRHFSTVRGSLQPLFSRETFCICAASQTSSPRLVLSRL